MRWTVVVPGALLPAPIAADVLSAAHAGWLARVLTRAHREPPTRLDAGNAPHLSWLWSRFGGAGEPVTAPYALRALDETADAGAQCWHVDPVHFEFARDHLLVAPVDAPPTPQEVAKLALRLQAALDEHATNFGPKLHVYRDRWLLVLARPWSMRSTPLDGAFGQPVLEHWPSGTDASVWRRLLNDVQMRWHHEPLDEARDARGSRTINGLWLHGGGTWANLPVRPFATVADADPVLRGWALASGVPREDLHEGEATPMRGDTVSIRRDLLLPAQFEAWSQWLAQLTQLQKSLRQLQEASFAAGYDELALVLCGRRQARVVRIRRGDAWRLWRRAPLAPLLAEAD